MNSSSVKIMDRKLYFLSISIIGAFFFIFGFVTWLNGILIPYLKIACELNNFESYFVTTAFYISYFVMAIPSSFVLEKTGFKKGMMVGLFVMAVGALLFIPAAQTRTYSIFLLGLFIMGTGLAILQTAANPYITILGSPHRAAQRISIMGICNKVAGAIAPLLLAQIILHDGDELMSKLNLASIAEKNILLNELASRVINPYIIMVLVLIGLAIMVYFSPLPDIDADKDEKVTDSNSKKTSIFQFPHLILGVITLFLYVGVEVIAGDTIISYGTSQGIELSTAKFFTTLTLIAMIIGYILGIIAIPKFITQETALKISAILGLIFSVGAIFFQGYASVLFIALLGLANALMWPAIWPLAISGLGKFTKMGASLLIMAIAGGAILPPIYGWLADILNPQQAYWMMLPCYCFVLYYAMVGHAIRK